ncbi:MAG: hypothetical protein ACR2N3_07445 [Pyrinomonadaceae bacterium]
MDGIAAGDYSFVNTAKGTSAKPNAAKKVSPKTVGNPVSGETPNQPAAALPKQNPPSNPSQTPLPNGYPVLTNYPRITNSVEPPKNNAAARPPGGKKPPKRKSKP